MKSVCSDAVWSDNAPSGVLLKCIHHFLETLRGDEFHVVIADEQILQVRALLVQKFRTAVVSPRVAEILRVLQSKCLWWKVSREVLLGLGSCRDIYHAGTVCPRKLREFLGHEAHRALWRMIADDDDADHGLGGCSVGTTLCVLGSHPVVECLEGAFQISKGQFSVFVQRRGLGIDNYHFATAADGLLRKRCHGIDDEAGT